MNHHYGWCSFCLSCGQGSQPVVHSPVLPREIGQRADPRLHCARRCEETLAAPAAMVWPPSGGTHQQAEKAGSKHSADIRALAVGTAHAPTSAVPPRNNSRRAIVILLSNAWFRGSS